MSTPTTAPAGLTEQTVWSNRRAAIRQQTGRSVSSRIAGRSAAIVNISLGGVALRVSRRLRRGTRVLIRLDNPVIGLSYDLAARAAHAFERADGKWIIGFQFARPLTPQELATLL